MDGNDALIEFFGRIDEHVAEILEGLGPDALTWQPVDGTNPIGWLVLPSGYIWSMRLFIVVQS